MLPKVTLPGGASTSVLGFGCSALLGGRTKREARYLLDVAFDSGIRHFDVARVYGTGDAEAVVGEFAQGRRDSLTIASKFGIDPAADSASVNLGKGAVRLATRRSRRLLALARRYGGKTVRRGVFSPGKARASLRVSLEKLKTTYLDVYFLHDCARADWAQPDLQAALEQLSDECLISAFGPATALAEVTAILDAGDCRPRIAQFGADLLDGANPSDATDSGTTAITHGVFRTAFEGLSRLLEDPGRAKQWSAQLDLDLASADVRGDLLLVTALHCNPGGVVLVSSGSPVRIQRNATCAASCPFHAEQLSGFKRLLTESQ